MAKVKSMTEAKALIKKSKPGKPNDFNHVNEKGHVTRNNYWVCEDGNIFTDYNSMMNYTSKRKLKYYHIGTEVK